MLHNVVPQSFSKTHLFYINSIGATVALKYAVDELDMLKRLK